MSRRRRARERPGPTGFLVVDKPVGWTSHDVVDAARHWLSTRRVGHLGTLDPLATGVLPLAVRAATRLAPFTAGGAKVYTGAFELGVETDTFDAEGRVTRRHEGSLPERERLDAAVARFRGEIEQIPPMFSAVKRGGVPLHKLARAGREVEREPRRVRVERFELLHYAPPLLEIEVECSPGTYVRSLAADLGRELGCGAHLACLRRTRSGAFGLSQAVTVDLAEREAEAGKLEARLLPAVGVLGLPLLRLDPQETRRVLHGGDIAAPEISAAPGQRVAAVEPGGDLVAILELRPGRRLHPLRVLGPVAPPG